MFEIVLGVGTEEEEGAGTDAELAALPKNEFIPPDCTGFLTPSDDGVDDGLPKEELEEEEEEEEAIGRPLSPPPDCLDADILKSEGGSMRP